MAFTWPAKDPDEILDYEHDWTARLAGDQIVGEPFAEVVSGDVVIDSTDSLLGVQKTWLSGGTEGQQCVLLLRVFTANGRKMDESIKIKIKSR